MESLSVPGPVEGDFFWDEELEVHPGSDLEVHPGSDRTNRSVAQNEAPRTNRVVSLRGFKLPVAFPKTDLKPLNDNLQHIKHQFCRVT